jgi:hypothetical protein
MSYKHPFKPHAFKGISLAQLMGLAKPARKVPLYQYQGAKGDIEVMSRGLTVVLSREINANVRIAADIAVNVARKNPERPVWYVNTFAGIELMQEVMEEACRNNPPLTPPAAAGGEYEKSAAAAAAGGEQDHSVIPAKSLPSTRSGAGIQARRTEGHGAGLDPRLRGDDKLGALPNLHFFEVPIGQWDVEALSAALRGESEEEYDPSKDETLKQWQRDYHKAQKEKKQQEVEQPRPIVIINSFDYAPLSRRGKWGMARDLMAMLEAFDMSLIVFTQEMRLEFGAGVAGRGSVGLMCGLAERVARLTDPFEHLIRSRKPLNPSETATVHEAQMHAPDGRQRTIIVKNQQGDTEVELFGSDNFKLAREIGKILME